MDLDKYWETLREMYSEEKAKLLTKLTELDPVSDEYKVVREHLKDLQTVESKELENAAKVAEHGLKERQFEAAEVERELDASTAIKPRELLAAAVPVVCTVLVLTFEFVGHGAISSKAFGKIPFTFR